VNTHWWLFKGPQSVFQPALCPAAAHMCTFGGGRLWRRSSGTKLDLCFNLRCVLLQQTCALLVTAACGGVRVEQNLICVLTCAVSCCSTHLHFWRRPLVEAFEWKKNCCFLNFAVSCCSTHVHFWWRPLVEAFEWNKT
jgi:hypothetical protein